MVAPEVVGRRRPGCVSSSGADHLYRAREVSITPKGRHLLGQAREMARQVEGEVLGGLTAEERRQLLELLRRAFSSAPPQSLWVAGEGD